MPSDLPRGRVHSALKRLGFAVAREKGPHTTYQDSARPERILQLPRHPKIKRRLLQGILKRTGVSEEDFMANY